MAEETKKVQKLVEEIQGLSVMELAELVKELQDKLGVSAIAPAPAASGQSQEAAAPAPQEGQQGSGVQTVVLTNAGANKIAVIKALREINPSLGLKEAKDMTEKLPAEVLKDAKAEEAKAAAEKLQAAGAQVELK
jgi:large subunit ribosomal protein L7/L12